MKAKTIVKAMKTLFTTIKSKGYTPKLNITDNVAKIKIKEHLTDKDCRCHLVEPMNHRVNAAKRANQT